MKLKITILVAFALCIVVACTKDSFSTTPQLTFKSVNATVIGGGGVLAFSLDYTDKDGDITGVKDTSSYLDTLGGALYYVKKSINCSDSISGWYNLPQDVPATSNSKGTIDITFTYGTVPVPGSVSIGRGCYDSDDTCVFKFVLKDKAGHRSDTVTSPQIVLLKS